MVKARRFLVFLFLLLTCLFIHPYTVSSAVMKRRLVILDLPYLDLQEFSGKYPNLEQLVSTGSTGLVRISLSQINRNSNSFIQPTIEQVLRHESAITVVNSKRNRSLPQRLSPAVIINGDYFIGFTDETPKTLRNSFSITGNFKTGIDTILKYYQFYRARADIILITFGINRFTGLGKEQSGRQKILAYYDNLVSRIVAETNFTNTLLMVCSSHPPAQLTFMNSSLTPVILKGLNFPAGILYAPSTRKSGILTLNDLRCTVLKFLNPKTQTVFPFKNISGEWHTVAKNQHGLVKNYAIRWPVLTYYGYLLLGVIFLLIAAFIFHFHRIIISFLTWSYLYLLTTPAAFLLEALFDPLNWMSITIFTFFISGILFLCSYFFSGKSLSKTLLFISFLTAGLVVIDGLFNGYYEHKSILGYSLVAGARYYGIGNEYMGILMGSYIVGVALSLQRLRKWRREILWCTTLFISLTLIHPYFGADVGGGITALMGLGITNYLWMKQSIRFKEISQLTFLTLFVVIFMGILDLYVYESSMSHLGKLLLSIQKNGMVVFIDLVIRKLELNLRLISSTPLTLILIGILLTIPFLHRYPPVSVKRLMEKYPDIISGLTGLAITAFIGLVTNDSGIVSAAMIFLFGIGLIIPMIIKEWRGITV